jgi:hypothetical protein
VRRHAEESKAIMVAWLPDKLGTAQHGSAEKDSFNYASGTKLPVEF